MDQLISVNGISLLHQSNQDAMETLRKAMQAHGVSSPVMSITVARDLPREQEHNQSSASRNGTEPLVINHVVRVPSMSNLLSISPQSDISPPKPPRLYQNMPAIPPITISGRTNEPILIEGDDSFAEVMVSSLWWIVKYTSVLIVVDLINTICRHLVIVFNQ